MQLLKKNNNKQDQLGFEVGRSVICIFFFIFIFFLFFSFSLDLNKLLEINNVYDQKKLPA